MYELTEEQHAVCAQVVNVKGKRRQIRKVAEELEELAEELRLAAKGKGDLNRIINERDDVAITLHQLDSLILPQIVEGAAERIQRKIDFLEKRIADEAL